MRLVPIPPDKLAVSAHIWKPLVESIAKRQRCHPDQRLIEVYSGAVKLILIVDNHIPKALLGLSIMQRGADNVARIVWAVGKDRHRWVGLLPELERMMRDIGCVGMEALARPGWTKELKRQGYRPTHIEFEKDL